MHSFSQKAALINHTNTVMHGKTEGFDLGGSGGSGAGGLGVRPLPTPNFPNGGTLHSFSVSGMSDFVRAPPRGTPGAPHAPGDTFHANGCSSFSYPRPPSNIPHSLPLTTDAAAKTPPSTVTRRRRTEAAKIQRLTHRSTKRRETRSEFRNWRLTAKINMKEQRSCGPALPNRRREPSKVCTRNSPPQFLRQHPSYPQHPSKKQPNPNDPEPGTHPRQHRRKRHQQRRPNRTPHNPTAQTPQDNKQQAQTQQLTTQQQQGMTGADANAQLTGEPNGSDPGETGESAGHVRAGERAGAGAGDVLGVRR